MNIKNLTNIKEKEIVPGFHGKFVHSENMTIAYWHIDARSILPEHTHIHEQIVNVMEGTLKLKIENETQTLTAGHVAVIPPNVPHSGEAVTACTVIDVFYPARKDYQK